jgi:hypothetical protein
VCLGFTLIFGGKWCFCYKKVLGGFLLPYIKLLNGDVYIKAVLNLPVNLRSGATKPDFHLVLTPME